MRMNLRPMIVANTKSQYFFSSQEAARLQRESSIQPPWTSPSIVTARPSYQSNLFGVNSGNSCSSSRESSLGPISSIAAGSSSGGYHADTTNQALLSVKTPRQIVIERNRAQASNFSSSSSSNGFGFTLRHFIVYPPEVSN